jgi:hypothetical protein
MRKIVLTYGFLAGAIMAACMSITLGFQDQIGLGHSYVVGYAGMVLGFLMVFFGVRSYRDNVAGGAVSFGRAFKVGILITVLASACYVLTWEIMYFKFMPDFMDKYQAYETQKAKAAGVPQAEIEKQAKSMAQLKEMYKNPLINSAMTFVEPLPVGLLMTLIAAGVLSRKRKGVAG